MAVDGVRETVGSCDVESDDRLLITELLARRPAWSRRSLSRCDYSVAIRGSVSVALPCELCPAAAAAGLR